MNDTSNSLDVLCVGHASYDLILSVPRHPAADEKTVAGDMLCCGGGPAANAAVCVSRLGYRAGFCGYLGEDVHGDSHLEELTMQAIDTRFVRRGDTPTPLSVVLVKPDGSRALVNYKGETRALPTGSIDFSNLSTRVLLADGHEPWLTRQLLTQPHTPRPISVLDAGSLHEGTQILLDKMDYLACSEKFARQYAGSVDSALDRLAALAPAVVITLGEHGLVWRCGAESGRLAAPAVQAVDTTGAGDAFHGAFAAGLAAGMPWPELLRYASAAGAFCCTVLGARPGQPVIEELATVLAAWPES